ncbi:MAG TPA: hypothetical protein VGS80_21375 [Ktedonobacterales bacterium]|jgi:hypothetical protein|nr:hypothetical protein [Ktedonobacterales bacterium]
MDCEKGLALVDVMRFTVIDDRGTVSFVAHTSAALALTAACAENPVSLDDLLTATRKYDRRLRDIVIHGLAVFDEHNLLGETATIHHQLTSLPPRETPVFRVLDDETRQASLMPVRAGVILFNLPSKRIVQIANTDEVLIRSGKVNYHNGQFLSRREFEYELPAEWSIVP